MRTLKAIRAMEQAIKEYAKIAEEEGEGGEIAPTIARILLKECSTHVSWIIKLLKK